MWRFLRADSGPGRGRLPHRLRDPELLGICASLRPAGSSVRGRAFVEPAIASRPGLRVERAVSGPPRPHDVFDVSRIPAGRDRPSRTPLRRPRAPVRVDRPHLSPASSARELALLRGARRPAGLPRWADRMPSSGAVGIDPGYLEPASRLPHGMEGPPDLGHPPGPFLLRGCEAGDT